MEKFLTIIVPTYNMEKYLYKCLDSLIIKNCFLFKKLEVLIVNDGSKDSSSFIAHKYEKKYPEVFRVIDKENGNYGSCVNRGLAEAKGKYVKVLDADDYFTTDAFERYLSAFQNIDTDLILNDYNRVDENGMIKAKRRLYLLGIEDEKVLPFQELVNVAGNLWLYYVAYKTDKIRAIGYRQTEGISFTDNEWMFEPMTTVENFFYIKEPVYNYLDGREGQTMDINVRKKTLWMNLQVIGNMVRAYEKHVEVDNDHKKYFERRILNEINTNYSFYIYKYKDMNMKELIDFDSQLSQISPEFYNKSETLVISNTIKFPYIKYWRKNHKFHRPLKYRLCKLYHSIKFQVLGR